MAIRIVGVDLPQNKRGELKVKKVTLDPEKIDFDDMPELERWIENAFRDGYAKAQEIATDKMKPLMGALGNFGM